MKNFTKILIFKTFLALICFPVSAATIYGKVVGNSVKWNNAFYSDGDIIVENNWHSAESLKLLPVKSFLPGFIPNGMDKLTFLSSAKGSSVDVDFQLAMSSYKSWYAGATDVLPNSIGDLCDKSSVSSSEMKVIGSDHLCVASEYLSYLDKAVEPFKYYRVGFRLIDLSEAFRAVNAPEGIYSATFTYNLGYASILESGFPTYNYYPTEPVTIILDYKPSFIESVQINGDGNFDLTYDTEAHTVSGSTNYNVLVNGSIEPGIKMTFVSSGIEDEFKLSRRDKSGAYEIPYNITCERCRNRKVVENGKFVDSEETSFIDYVGSGLFFKLNFSFDDKKYDGDGIVGDVGEGIYEDTVTVLIELNL